MRPLPQVGVHITLALLEGELHGHALLRRVREVSGSPLGPVALHAALDRLIHDGLVVETTNRDERVEGQRHRYYELTLIGRTVALDELIRLQALMRRINGRLNGGVTAEV